MKRILSGMVILLFSAMCAGFSGEAAVAGQEDFSVAAAATRAENNEIVESNAVAGGSAAVADNNVVAGDSVVAAGNDAGAANSSAADDMSVAAVDNTKKQHSLLRVMMQSGAPTEEQALVLAKKKAVAHVIQVFQERNIDKEYSVSVFMLAEEYEKFVIAANVRTREITPDGISLETRIDIDGSDLMAAMAEYEIKSDKSEVQDSVKQAAG